MLCCKRISRTPQVAYGTGTYDVQHNTACMLVFWDSALARVTSGCTVMCADNVMVVLLLLLLFQHL